jgi:hypothetical protein
LGIASNGLVVVQFAMLVKVYGPAPEGQRRYSPAECIGAVKHRVEGNPDAEPNEKIEFRFDVAVHEPPIVDGQPILEMLVQYRDRVNGIVEAFKPCLA